MTNDPRLQAALNSHQAGDLAAAARLYGEVLLADPKNFHALYFLGFLRIQTGDLVEAERFLDAALAVEPRALDALYNRGRVLLELKRPADAFACFDAMLAINPNIHEALFHRANLLCDSQRLEEAIADYDRAVVLAPEFVEAWNNRGYALSFAGRLEDALGSYERALSLKPSDQRTLNHRGLTLFELKRYGEAARDFASVLKVDPEFPFARGNLLYSRLHCCDWRNVEEEIARAIVELRQGKRILMPQQAATVVSSPHDVLRCSRLLSADQNPQTTRPLWLGERYRHQRLRLGYLSGDLHAHATAFLMAGVFEAHDRSRFEVTAFSYGPNDRSHIRQRLERAFNRFIDVRDKSDDEVAQMLRQMEIDIAIDLKGHTSNSRSGILALRPAPVQVHYLGFPGSLGMSHIDYIIADRVVIPEGDESAYSEKIVTLPETYQCNDRSRLIAPATPSRGELGLPETGFVFCSFNNSFKIRPQMFGLWMRLLSSVGGSVLWLLRDNPEAVQNLRLEAEKHGVAAARLVFAPRDMPHLHLARHRLADLFLDTLPCGAHTTASDALWAGVPVLTCIGDTFAGRVAASLLHAVGLPEMITHTLADYEALALKFARDKSALAAVTSKLRDNRNSHPLFDTVRFTRHLEAAYIHMWERAQRGEAPDHFTVPALP